MSKLLTMITGHIVKTRLENGEVINELQLTLTGLQNRKNQPVHHISNLSTNKSKKEVTA